MKKAAGIFWQMEDEPRIRAALRALRNKHGLSQEQLGEISGLGQTDISKLESGRSKLTVEKIVRIAHALGEDVDGILQKSPTISQEESSTRLRPSLRLSNRKVLEQGLPALPVRGIAQGGNGRVYMLPVESFPVDLTARPATLANVEDAYALYIFEDSMHPMYKHGWTVWVHPHQPPAPGDGVVIIKNDDEVFVKELVRRTDRVVRVKRYRPDEGEFDIPLSDIKAIHRIVGCLQGR